MQDFRKLKVWQKSHSLVLHVYAITANFPKTETFGITAQSASGGGVDRREHCGGKRTQRRQGIRAVSLHVAWISERARVLLNSNSGPWPAEAF